MRKSIHVVCWALLIKLFVFLIDPSVMFFLGDSASYIHTALTGWLPADRSFLYGFIIRWLTATSGSLTSVVFFQVICSGMVALSVAYLLRTFLGVRRWVAYFFALLCALDPLQLMYERYVMAETLSLFVFMMYTVFAFHYLRRPKIVLFIPLALSGAILVALRVSFLPVVVAGAFLLPAFFSQRNKSAVHLSAF